MTSSSHHIEDIANPSCQSSTVSKATESSVASATPPITTGSPDVANLVTLMGCSSTNIISSSPEIHHQELHQIHPKQQNRLHTITTPRGSQTPHLQPTTEDASTPRKDSMRPDLSSNTTTTQTQHPFLYTTNTTTPTAKIPHLPTLDPTAQTVTSTTTPANSIYYPMPKTPPTTTPYIPRSDNAASGHRACARLNCTMTANIAVRGTAAERQNGGWLCLWHEGELELSVVSMYLDWFDSPYRPGVERG
ncbi:hypothetical protein T440DRAFT_540221 [Plenodomus tracheiphilus IPT5]|uniref:Uncharacterized protein n=1 Tax=Plenodomus tracheiphilus IPT5 TaxID=1408161 RepID=A0A6A7AY90_9PLEO|nr:hypothetical protein T440DRAFT_540221 [Plenodomus tracheiphilus IPT5]